MQTFEQKPFNQSDTFQHALGTLSASPRQVDSADWELFQTLFSGRSKSAFKPDFELCGITRLSDICVALGISESRSDFSRMLKAGSVKFANSFNRAVQIKQDVTIDLTVPDGLEIRVRRKCCEILVLSLDTKTGDET